MRCTILEINPKIYIIRGTSYTFFHQLRIIRRYRL